MMAGRTSAHEANGGVYCKAEEGSAQVVGSPQWKGISVGWVNASIMSKDHGISLYCHHFNRLWVHNVRYLSLKGWAYDYDITTVYSVVKFAIIKRIIFGD